MCSLFIYDSLYHACYYLIQDVKKKEKELQAMEAELNKREKVCMLQLLSDWIVLLLLAS